MVYVPRIGVSQVPPLSYRYLSRAFSPRYSYIFFPNRYGADLRLYLSLSSSFFNGTFPGTPCIVISALSYPPSSIPIALTHGYVGISVFLFLSCRPTHAFRLMFLGVFSLYVYQLEVGLRGNWSF